MTDRVQERPQWYVQEINNPSLISGFSQENLVIQTDSDAPFRLFAIGLYIFSSTGTPEGAQGNIGAELRLYRPDEALGMSKHIISAQALNPYDSAAVNGAGGQTAPYLSLPSPINPNILYPAQSAIQFDFQTLASVTYARAYIVFIGTKLGAPGQFWNGRYPSRYKARPFNGYTIQLPTANLPLLDQPLTIRRDADFVLQTAVQTSYPAAALTPVGALRGLGIRMKDWRGKYYMNNYVPIELIFGGFSYSQTPGVIYPEIYIPRNQQITFDLAAL